MALKPYGYSDDDCPLTKEGAWWQLCWTLCAVIDRNHRIPVSSP